MYAYKHAIFYLKNIHGLSDVTTAHTITDPLQWERLDLNRRAPVWGNNGILILIMGISFIVGVSAEGKRKVSVTLFK